MGKLKTDWQQEKGEMQAKLRESVEKCRTLSKHLQKTANQMRTRKEVERKESELSQTCNLEDQVQRNTLKLFEAKHK